MQFRAPTAADFAARTAPPLVIGAIAHLSGRAPKRTELVDHVGSVIDQLPTLRTYLTDRWITETPRLEMRIRRLTTSTWDAAVQAFTSEPLPSDGPPWDVTVVDGYAPESYSICCRVDHCVCDYGALVRILEVLFGPVRRSSAAVAEVASRKLVRQLPTAARLMATSVARSKIWPISAYGTTSARTYRWERVPVARLEHSGATRNDVYVAAMAGATMDWLAARGIPVPQTGVELMVPVNVRRSGQLSAPGNHAVPLRMAVETPDPDWVTRRTEPVRLPGTRQALRLLSDLVPRPLLIRALPRLLDPAYASVTASSFRLRHMLTFRGDVVRCVDPIMACPPGYPAAALALTYADTMSVCFATDSVLPGMDRLHRLWADRIGRDDAAGDAVAGGHGRPAGAGRGCGPERPH